MDKIIEALRTVLGVGKWIGPILTVNPPWACRLYFLTCVLVISTVVVFFVNLPKAIHRLDKSRRPSLDRNPYQGFADAFREVAAPYQLRDSGSLLHVVWGNLGEIRDTIVVLPINQSFDFEQRGPRSVLSSFEGHKIGDMPFYDNLENKWPSSARPNSAGIGTTQFWTLKDESYGLAGVIFVVTTRDLSRASRDYGLYNNTPIEGIDYVLDKTLEEIRSQQIASVAIPLLGTGYANIDLAHGDTKLKAVLEEAVIVLSIDKLLKELADPSSPLRRAVLVIYSPNPHNEEENDEWKLVSRFLTSDSGARKEAIKQLLAEFAEKAKGS